jgi:hypothetical protein
MWNRLREAVAGIAEQAGVEVPGLESAASTVADVAASAGDGVGGVIAEIGGSDGVASVTDAAGSMGPTEMVAGSGEAAASTGEVVAGAVEEASTRATELLGGLSGDPFP